MARIGSPSNQRIARTQLGANENLFLTIFRDRSGLELILRNKYKMRTGPQGPPSRYVGKLEGSARVREGSRLTTTLVTLVSLLYSAMQTCNTPLSIAALPAFLRCCLLVTFVCFSLHFCATYHFPIKNFYWFSKGFLKISHMEVKVKPKSVPVLISAAGLRWCWWCRLCFMAGNYLLSLTPSSPLRTVHAQIWYSILGRKEFPFCWLFHGVGWCGYELGPFSWEKEPLLTLLWHMACGASPGGETPRTSTTHTAVALLPNRFTLHVWLPTVGLRRSNL